MNSSNEIFPGLTRVGDCVRQAAALVGSLLGRMRRTISRANESRSLAKTFLEAFSDPALPARGGVKMEENWRFEILITGKEKGAKPTKRRLC
jgi:hypothetical protein